MNPADHIVCGRESNMPPKTFSDYRPLGNQTNGMPPSNTNSQSVLPNSTSAEAPESWLDDDNFAAAGASSDVQTYLSVRDPHNPLPLGYQFDLNQQALRRQQQGSVSLAPPEIPPNNVLWPEAQPLPKPKVPVSMPRSFLPYWASRIGEDPADVLKHYNEEMAGFIEPGPLAEDLLVSMATQAMSIKDLPDRAKYVKACLHYLTEITPTSEAFIKPLLQKIQAFGLEEFKKREKNRAAMFLKFAADLSAASSVAAEDLRLKFIREARLIPSQSRTNAVLQRICADLLAINAKAAGVGRDYIVTFLIEEARKEMMENRPKEAKKCLSKAAQQESDLQHAMFCLLSHVDRFLRNSDIKGASFFFNFLYDLPSYKFQTRKPNLREFWMHAVFVLIRAGQHGIGDLCLHRFQLEAEGRDRDQEKTLFKVFVKEIFCHLEGQYIDRSRLDKGAFDAVRFKQAHACFTKLFLWLDATTISMKEAENLFSARANTFIAASDLHAAQMCLKFLGTILTKKALSSNEVQQSWKALCYAYLKNKDFDAVKVCLGSLAQYAWKVGVRVPEVTPAFVSCAAEFVLKSDFDAYGRCLELLRTGVLATVPPDESAPDNAWMLSICVSLVDKNFIEVECCFDKKRQEAQRARSRVPDISHWIKLAAEKFLTASESAAAERCLKLLDVHLLDLRSEEPIEVVLWHILRAQYVRAGDTDGATRLFENTCTKRARIQPSTTEVSRDRINEEYRKLFDSLVSAASFIDAEMCLQYAQIESGELGLAQASVMELWLKLIKACFNRADFEASDRCIEYLRDYMHAKQVSCGGDYYFIYSQILRAVDDKKFKDAVKCFERIGILSRTMQQPALYKAQDWLDAASAYIGSRLWSEAELCLSFAKVSAQEAGEPAPDANEQWEKIDSANIILRRESATDRERKALAFNEGMGRLSWLAHTLEDIEGVPFLVQTQIESLLEDQQSL